MIGTAIRLAMKCLNVSDRSFNMLRAEAIRWPELVERNLFVFLPNTSTADAAAIAERIRTTINLTTITAGIKRKVNITISAGVAGTVAYDAVTPQALFSMADKALYLAKDKGRNRVVISDTSNPGVYKKRKTRA